MIDNHMNRPIVWKWIDCTYCSGKGTIKRIIDDYDEIKEECPECGGSGTIKIPT